MVQNSVKSCIYARRSVRRFTERRVERPLLEELLMAGCMAPTGSNMQSWRFMASGRSCTHQGDLRSLPRAIGYSSLHPGAVYGRGVGPKKRRRLRTGSACCNGSEHGGGEHHAACCGIRPGYLCRQILSADAGASPAGLAGAHRRAFAHDAGIFGKNP